MSNRFLTEQFYVWREVGEPLVLATVTETSGSTYSKAGQQLLIRANGDYVGLVGGGCLEGDLVLRAEEVLANGESLMLTYDMRDEADDLWGMGLGCRGMMQLLLQRLDETNDWEPFTTLAGLMQQREPTRVALGAHGELVAGDSDEYAVRWTIAPWPRLLLLGAGPDAGPVVQIARTMGWHVTVAEHREHYLQSPLLERADEKLHVNPSLLNDATDLARYSAVVIMSHHLESDREYLRSLAAHIHDYVGILGPQARRDELLAQLELTHSEFAKRLRGPVGIDIGAKSPQSIALAVVAEIQRQLSGVSKTQ